MNKKFDIDNIKDVIFEKKGYVLAWVPIDDYHIPLNNRDKKIILAIPEMIEVIKMARIMIKSRNFQGVCDEEIALENALIVLDKKHVAEV